MGSVHFFLVINVRSPGADFWHTPLGFVRHTCSSSSEMWGEIPFL